jgi:para-aminobenzoate synthetase
MSVEEYESVFQLVSVIEGDLEGSGIPVLAASLPPGSMTGAPKKRSCELLQELEAGKVRGLYSGVFGYLDVGGGGDFSVVIRSAFKWYDEDWRIGAGGAVTALSDAEAEWHEMLAKRENLLRAFI